MRRRSKKRTSCLLKARVIRPCRQFDWRSSRTPGTLSCGLRSTWSRRTWLARSPSKKNRNASGRKRRPPPKRLRAKKRPGRGRRIPRGLAPHGNSGKTQELQTRWLPEQDHKWPQPRGRHWCNCCGILAVAGVGYAVFHHPAPSLALLPHWPMSHLLSLPRTARLRSTANRSPAPGHAWLQLKLRAATR